MKLSRTTLARYGSWLIRAEFRGVVSATAAVTIIGILLGSPVVFPRIYPPASYGQSVFSSSVE
jgi:hypothetical protein